MKTAHRSPGFSRRSRLAATLLVLASGAGVADGPHTRTNPNGAESQLQRIFEEIAQNKLDAALDAANRLTAVYPNFRLAHLVRGDLLLARARPITDIGNTGHAAADRLEELRAEIHARVRAYAEHPPENLIPRYLLRFAPGQENAVVVDASRSRVYVYENRDGMPRLVEDFYATIGKRGFEKVVEGDQKTPIGVYHVTSQIPGSKLPDLYGWGAFPINYPNAWDRLNRKTGYGIWLHGVPADTYARPPLASDGCIALANPDIALLAKRVQPGTTPVIIAKRVEWVTPDAWRAEGDRFMQQLEAWRRDWESLDTDRYLAHYSRTFRSGSMDIDTWGAHKRRINASKTWIKVAFENVSVFSSPAAGNLVVVAFDQNYRSSTFTQRTRKQQYWIVEDGRWKIVYEAPVGHPVLALPESFPTGAR
ncbi:MAG: murein L,D-transpeptidase family protein [Burkholderiales bacterium]